MTKRIGIGQGFTEEEALNNWLTTDTSLSHEGIAFGEDALDKTKPILVEVIRQPKIAKRVSCEVHHRQGLRKYQTFYCLYFEVGHIDTSHVPIPEGIPFRFINGRRYFATQKEALFAAKLMSNGCHAPILVEAEKIQINGSPLVARVIPGNSTMGEYKFTAHFLY